MNETAFDHFYMLCSFDNTVRDEEDMVNLIDKLIPLAESEWSLDTFIMMLRNERRKLAST